MSRLIAPLMGLFIFVQTASAGELLDFNSNTDSAFVQLLDMHDNGTAFEIDSILGYNIGRCFEDLEPDFALNSLVAAETLTFDDDRGPAFPPRTEIRMAFLHYRDSTGRARPANYFENYDFERDPLNVEGASQFEMNFGSPVYFIGGQAQFDYVRTGQHAISLNFSAVAHGNFIVTKIRSNRDQMMYSYSQGRFRHVVRGQVTTMCYAFETVSDEPVED